jgi:hypothetical protein
LISGRRGGTEAGGIAQVSGRQAVGSGDRRRRPARVRSQAEAGRMGP